jgi:hypothetical protein
MENPSSRNDAEAPRLEAPRGEVSIFLRSPRAWEIFLTIGCCHAFLAVSANLAPRMLPHLRTSFVHEGAFDWASVHSFVVLWVLVSLVYYSALHLLSGSRTLALRWIATWVGFLSAASALTLTLPSMADVPFVSNLCFALAMTLFVQSFVEARLGRRGLP